MPRRSSRPQPSPEVPKKRGRPSSTRTTVPTTPERQSKRIKPSTVKPAATKATPTKSQSKRIKSSTVTPAAAKATPTKSQYFSDPASDTASDEESEASVEESGYEDEDASAVPSPTDEEPSEDEEYDSEEVPKAKRGRAKNKGSNGGTVSRVIEKGKELWRQGVKAGLGPGKEVLIKIPKPRSAGSTPYTESTIHPNTMLFLEELAENNDREWLKMHDANYRSSKKDWDDFVEALTPAIIEKDETIPELPSKDVTFRIYRDIRFTPDPTPYKTYFSAAWSRTGRKGPYAGYYVQIKPGGGSFVGGGLWMPEAQALAALRRDVDRRSHKIKSVLTEPGMRKEFFGSVPNDEKKAVKAFVGQNTENALKTKPKVSWPQAIIHCACNTHGQCAPADDVCQISVDVAWLSKLDLYRHVFIKASPFCSPYLS